MRFTIRDVLWLTVIVAMGLGWLVDRTAIKRFYAKFAADQANDATAIKKSIKNKNQIIDNKNQRLSLLESAIEKAGFKLKESADPAAQTSLFTLEPIDRQPKASP